MDPTRFAEELSGKSADLLSTGRIEIGPWTFVLTRPTEDHFDIDDLPDVGLGTLLDRADANAVVTNIWAGHRLIARVVPDLLAERPPTAGVLT